MPTRLLEQKVILFPLIVCHFRRDALRPGTYPVLCRSLTHWLVFAVNDAGSGNKRQNGFCCCSVTRLFDVLQPRGRKHVGRLCPPLSLGVCSNSCSLSWWCYPTISSSAALFSFCLQSFPASGSFPMSQFLVSGGQSTGVSVSASVLPMNIQGWSPLEWTAWISLQSKGLSRVFSSTTVQRHQFFSAQPTVWSTYHICTWLLDKS